MGKTNALNENDLADFIKLQKTKKDSENSWSVKIDTIDKTNYDLSVKNPNKKDETTLRSPVEILKEMKELDKESTDIINSIMKMI